MINGEKAYQESSGIRCLRVNMGRDLISSMRIDTAANQQTVISQIKAFTHK